MIVASRFKFCKGQSKYRTWFYSQHWISQNGKEYMEIKTTWRAKDNKNTLYGYIGMDGDLKHLI